MIEVHVEGSLWIDADDIGDALEMKERLRLVLEGAEYGDGVIDAIDIDVKVIG